MQISFNYQSVYQTRLLSHLSFIYQAPKCPLRLLEHSSKKHVRVRRTCACVRMRARARTRTREFWNTRTRTHAHARILKNAHAHARARENFFKCARARTRTREIFNTHVRARAWFFIFKSCFVTNMKLSLEELLRVRFFWRSLLLFNP